MGRVFAGPSVRKYEYEKNGTLMWRVRTTQPDKLYDDAHFALDDPEVDEYVRKQKRKLAQLDDMTWERAIRRYLDERLKNSEGIESVSAYETDRRLRAFYRLVLTARCAAMNAKLMHELYHGRWEGKTELLHGLRTAPMARRKGEPPPAPKDQPDMTKDERWKQNRCKLPCKCPGLGHPLAPDSHRNMLLEVGTFVRWCVEKGFLAEDPMMEETKGKTPALRGKGQRNKGGMGKNRLGKRELRALYAAAFVMAREDDRRGVAVLFLLLFGFRSFEARSRQRRFIDEVTWTVEIDPDAAKTDASERDNVIPKALRPVVKKMLARLGNEDHLFAEPGEPVPNKDWLRRALHAVCDRAEIRRVHPHSLRGAHNDLARKAGETAEAICKQMGHEDERTNEESYMTEMGRRGTRRATQKAVLHVLDPKLKKKASGGGE
jgi:integrase